MSGRSAGSRSWPFYRTISIPFGRRVRWRNRQSLAALRSQCLPVNSTDMRHEDGVMFRPRRDSRGLGGAWPARTLALLLPFLISSLAVEAAEPTRGAGAPMRVAENLGERFGPEDRAQELYLDAMEKLDAGLSAPAQNILADLVAKFPATKAASLARRRLGELRSGTLLKAAVIPAAPPPAAPRAAKPAAAVGNGPVWDQELRRNGAIQARLRMEAGDRVFFSRGSAELGSRARAALSAQARWLNRWREFEAAIEGHADEAGSEQEIMRLSRERAEAVRQRLVAEGVAPTRLAVVAQGNTQPVAVCEAPECRAQNRRVVTLVFVSGTSKRLGLDSGALAAPMGEVAAAPSEDGQPLQAPLAAEWDGTAR